MTYELNACPFCGEDNEIGIVTSESPVRRNVYVHCGHCAARGSSFTDLVMLDGEFEQTVEELTDEAVTYWNDAGEKQWQTHIQK